VPIGVVQAQKNLADQILLVFGEITAPTVILDTSVMFQLLETCVLSSPRSSEKSHPKQISSFWAGVNES